MGFSRKDSETKEEKEAREREEAAARDKESREKEGGGEKRSTGGQQPNDATQRAAAAQAPISTQQGTSQQTNPTNNETRKLSDEEVANMERYEPQGLSSRASFQSDEARAALADPSQADSLNERGIRRARVDAGVEEVTLVNQAKDFEKEIVIRPRQTIPRFKVGDTWYSIQEGVECVIPRHVATLLEQKGII